MAYVRRRTTKAGSVSTALVEAYRDKSGRPRQRVLANLHGEPTVLAALAKLWANSKALEVERDGLVEELRESSSAALDESGMPSALMVRSEDGVRLGTINAALAIIGREIPVLLEHCDASDEEINAAVQAFVKRRADVANAVLGGTFVYAEKLREAKRKLRRLTT
jgi:hypothetical protein